jgi:hypothetical protein
MPPDYRGIARFFMRLPVALPGVLSDGPAAGGRLAGVAAHGGLPFGGRRSPKGRAGPAVEKMLRAQTSPSDFGQKNILVRLAQGQRAFGVTVLCIGKTGILTQNCMTVGRLFTLEEDWTLGAYGHAGARLR